MTDEIETFIKFSFSPEQSDVLANSFDLLDAFGVEDYLDDYTELLLSSDDASDQDTASTFFSMTVERVNLILKAHEIKASDAVTLEQLNTVAQTLLVIQNYSDSDIIVATLMACNDDTDNFCELLTLVTDKSSDYFNTFIESVSGALNASIIDLHKETSNPIDYQDKKNATHTENVVRLKILAAMQTYAGATGFTLIKGNIPLGEPFDLYAEHILNVLSELDAESLVTEVIVLLAMSSDGVYAPLDTFRKWCHNHFDNLNLITKVDVALMKRLSLIDTEIAHANGHKGHTL